MARLADEKLISAQELIDQIHMMPVSMSPPWSSDPVVQAINSQISSAVSISLEDFKRALIYAIEKSATQESNCFLCKNPRPECEALPDDPHR